MNEEKWTLGILVGLPILGAVFLGCVIALVFGVREIRRNDGDLGWPVTLLGGFVALATLGLCAGIYYPYSAEYHRWKPVAGEVDQVQSRLISAGDSGGSNQKFVVRFKGNRQEYGCEDTRCSLLKPGEKLELSCVRVWIYAGADGFDCNFFRSESA